MGLRIGQTASTLASLRNTPEFGRVRLGGRGSALAQGVSGEQDPRGPFFRQEEPQVRVGFGDGTLSPQAAALRTIDRTVEEARRTLPSLEEIRARFQLRAAERRREAVEVEPADNEPAAREGDENVDRVERGIPAPGAQARNFVTPLNETGEIGAAQVEDVAPRAEPAAANPEVPPERSTSGLGETPPRFDVRV